QNRGTVSMAESAVTEFRDLTELGELCNCTEKQTRFAEGLLAGLNQTEAALRAGYAGARDSVQLRSAASAAARSKPVMALLALAESRGLGIPNSPGDREELIRILWAHARSKDKNSSISASKVLNELIAQDLGSKGEADPKSILLEIAQISPEFADQLDPTGQFNAWAELTEEQRDRVAAGREALARE